MKRFVAFLLLAFTVPAACYMAFGQPVGRQDQAGQSTNAPTNDPNNPSANEPGSEPVVDPGMDPNAQIEPGPQDMADATTEEAADATQPTTEPTTQDTTEPTTRPTTARTAKRFTRSATRPTGRGAVRWSGATTGAAGRLATTNPLQQRPMSDEFAVLQTKSMFVKGHDADTRRSNVREVGAPSTSPAIVRAAEGSLLFNGVTKTNDGVDAFIEDMGSGRVYTVKVGDAIAHGKVTKISMDSLDYENEASSKTLTVEIGQNLDGSGGASSTASPAPSSSPSGGGDDVPSDIIERLRRRRAAEGG